MFFNLGIDSGIDLNVYAISTYWRNICFFLVEKDRITWEVIYVPCITYKIYCIRAFSNSSLNYH